MSRLAELQAHIGSVDELLDLVGAMRSLAGMRLVEAQRALPGARRYAGILAEAIAGALTLLPESGEVSSSVGGRALILYASEHGFVGGFNEKLVEAAHPPDGERPALFVLGSRGAILAEEQGWRTVWTGVMATRSDGVPGAVRALATELYRRIAAGEIARVDLLHASHNPGTGIRIERRRLLPHEPAAAAPPRSRPLHGLAPALLVEKLIADYMFALLVEAGIGSLASENAARFMAMESARDALSRKLAALNQTARQTRQDEITTELLDLGVGTEAMAPPAPRREPASIA